MKKFSNHTDKEIKENNIQLKLDETVLKIVNDVIKTKIVNEELTTKDITLEGKQDLVDKIVKLLESEKSLAKFEVKETIKMSFNKFVNQKLVYETLDKLQKEYEKL